ncbi:TPA: hypothetical protein ACX3IO_003835 [Vibrio parahaemolyticus]|uniref:Uncharacterized protein n=1 Tax=Vibrio vulnificus TaxID=672 RepID=A0A2S3R6J3_VIBVL|nr:hypothetical protein CRN52_04985 [Vibrio vulnificus]
MQKASVAQASITKGFEREEPWYDHGDFTVLCGFGFGCYVVIDRFDGLSKTVLLWVVLRCVL